MRPPKDTTVTTFKPIAPGEKPPRLIDIDPSIATMEARLCELAREKIDCKNAARRLWLEMQAGAGAVQAANNEAVISGTETIDIASLSDQHQKALQRADLIEAALPTLSGKIRDAKTRASAVIRGLIEGEHRRLAKLNCLAIIEAHRASLQYVQFTDVLNSDGASWSSLGPCFLAMLGEPTKYGHVADFLEEACRDGFFRREDVPPELRK